MHKVNFLHKGGKKRERVQTHIWDWINKRSRSTNHKLKPLACNHTNSQFMKRLLFSGPRPSSGQFCHKNDVNRYGGTDMEELHREKKKKKKQQTHSCNF